MSHASTSGTTDYENMTPSEMADKLFAFVESIEPDAGERAREILRNACRRKFVYEGATFVAGLVADVRARYPMAARFTDDEIADAIKVAVGRPMFAGRDGLMMWATFVLRTPKASA